MQMMSCQMRRFEMKICCMPLAAWVHIAQMLMLTADDGLCPVDDAAADAYHES